MRKTNECNSFNAGFTLTELLVAMAIGLVGMVIVMQMFSITEKQRRTTISGSDAQINGVLGSFTIERDLRSAGFGVPNTGCTTVNGYDDNRVGNDFSFNPAPILITQNSPAGSSNDRIQLLYSGSDIGAIPATIQTSMPNSSSILRIENGVGFKDGQTILISEGTKACTLMQLTSDGQPTGTGNVTAPGTMWNLQHNPTSTMNPPGGHNIAPPGGYGVGAQVFNFASYINHAYYVTNNKLVMEDLRLDTGTTNPVEVVSGVIGFKAVYGRDTNADGTVDSWDNVAPANFQEVIAIRFGLLVRSGNYEKEVVTAANSISLWDGGPSIDLRPDTEANINNRDKHYRYKVYQTIVPLRNVIWGNAL